MKNLIQEEYDKCLVLNNLINYKLVFKEEENVKKWNSRNKGQENGKWKKRQEAIKKEENMSTETTPKTNKHNEVNQSIEFD